MGDQLQRVWHARGDDENRLCQLCNKASSPASSSTATTQLLSLAELAAGFAARHHIAGFLADRSTYLAASLKLSS